MDGADVPRVRIPKQIYKGLLEHAREDAPNECCGLIGGRDGAATTLYRARNAEASPLRYRIADQEVFDVRKQIEEKGEDLVAIYHSHTASPAYPSQTDINLAFWEWSKDGADRAGAGLAGHDLPDRVAGRGRGAAARLRHHRGRRGGRGRARDRVSGSVPSPETPAAACPRCALTHAGGERFCRECGMPLVYAGTREQQPITDAHEKARKIAPRTRAGSWSGSPAAASGRSELIQGICWTRACP